MSDLTPADLGFPPKFTAYRSGQADIALNLALSDKRFSRLDAPTGTGKSLIYMSLARLLDARTLVLVGTKGLQTQLLDDFRTLGMRDIRGQSNYRCAAVERGSLLDEYGMPGATCDQGPCKVGVYCPLKKDGGCTYYDAQKIAMRSSIVVSNYAYWLSLGRQADPMAIGKFDLLILDECHTAPDWLAEFCSVELNRSEIRTMLDLELPPTDEGVEVWATWARAAHETCEERYKARREELNTVLGTHGKRKMTDELLRMSRLVHELEELSRAHSWRSSAGPVKDVRLPGMTTDWVTQKTDGGIKFSPVWAHAYAEEYLFRKVPRVVLSSATLSPAVGKYLGIPDKDIDHHAVTSGFSPHRRPFTYIPTTRVDRNMVEGQVRQWITRIDNIIEGRLDRKGIIHTISYARVQLLLARSQYAGLMMTHTSHNMRRVVEQFKQAEAPVILLSPSVVEGFDFPYDEARYQIIVKVPFADGRDPVFKARCKSDKHYRAYTAALSLVQMAGRIVRAADDVGETFIIDDHWTWFRRSTPFPKWFREAWRVSKVIPPPPRVLPPTASRKPLRMTSSR
jgi:ATP-dependent DNA helicase DinG